MPRATSGQAILEYILLVAMIAVVLALTIRGSSHTICKYWTGLANQIAKPCANCRSNPGPPDCDNIQ